MNHLESLIQRKTHMRGFLSSFSCLFICTILLSAVNLGYAADPRVETLAIGAAAPDFNLQGTDDKFYSLADFASSELLMIVFTCNHCPTAQAYEDRLIDLTNEYGPKGVAVVAVSPNDPSAVRLDELGYTDLNDSLEEMKIRGEEKGFNFPYLYDGDLQEMTKAYGPMATPHVFIFDKDRILQYVGRIDDNEKIGAAKIHDTRDALNALLAGKEVAVQKTKTFGCSIKWADKGAGVAKADERWAKEPVTVDEIDAAGMREVMKNDTKNVRLINFWAMWCGPCVTEFAEFVDMQRMYGRRNFELVTVSMDDAKQQAEVLEFLKSEQAAMTNYHYTEEDAYALIDAVDENWPGALPYTVLVEPGGKIIFSMLGEIDPLVIKRAVVDYVGRYYD